MTTTERKAMANKISEVLVKTSNKMWGTPTAVKMTDGDLNVTICRELPASHRMELFSIKITDRTLVKKLVTSIWSIKYIPLRNEIDLQY